MKPYRARQLLGVLDHRLRLQAEAALDQAGWCLKWVSSAAEAVSYLQKQCFDAVLIQAELSDSTGRELLQPVMRMKNGLPVVLLAEPGEEAEVAAALGYGAAGYLVAGPTLPSLLPAVLEHVVQIARERELERRSFELLHLNELRQLSTTLRHELNNPLTGILGNAEMALTMPNLSRLLEQRLRHILQMAEQMRSVLRELEQFPDQPGHLLEVTARSR